MIDRINSVWFECAILNEVNIAPQSFFEFSPYPGVGQKSDRLSLSVKFHKNIHIAVCPLFPTGKRAKEPGLLYGLCGKILAYAVYHILFHRHYVWNIVCKYTLFC